MLPLNLNDLIDLDNNENRIFNAKALSTFVNNVST